MLKDKIKSEVYAVYDIWSDPPDKPNDIKECVKYCLDEYPNKRLLVHFTAPHSPYIGPTARTHLPDWQQQNTNDSILQKISKGEIKISDDILHQIYRENIDRVLPIVTDLLDDFTGKSVISADHGELLGERTSPLPVKAYGHIKHMFVNELLEVPWHVCEFNTRKEVKDSEPVTTNPDRFISSEREKTIQERLSELGYA
jgi:hypothetical protein